LEERSVDLNREHSTVTTVYTFKEKGWKMKKKLKKREKKPQPPSGR